MANLLTNVKEFWVTFSDSVCIDNFISRLHGRVTVTLLLMVSLLTTTSEFFGSPINCVTSESKSIDINALNAYCWVFSTFTVNKQLKGTIGKEVVYPGVAQGIPGQDDVIKHKYYQWVWMILCVQAMIFYIPRYLWITLEGGRVHMLISHLENPEFDSSWYKSKLKKVAVYLTEYSLNKHKSYTIQYALVEVLNLVNVVGQMFLFDFFLGGRLFNYGNKVFRSMFSGEDNSYEIIMARAFPKLSKCLFYNYGPSGTIQHIDALCVLSHNIINEKIVTFLYFWYIFLTIASVTTLLYRGIMLEPRICFFVHKFRFGQETSSMKTSYILTKFDYGDCFFLCQLKRNMSSFLFSKLLNEIVMHLDIISAQAKSKSWKPTRIDFSQNDEEREISDQGCSDVKRNEFGKSSESVTEIV